MKIVLAGCVTLVTGGMHGVGRGVATILRDAGATVVVCGPTASEQVDDGIEFRTCDVRDPVAVDRLVDGIAHDHEGLDILVNNVGSSPSAPAADATTRELAKLVELTLLAPLYVARAANAVMQSQGGGSIVNISGLAGRRASPGGAVSGAAQAGLESLTASLAVEWAPKVRVNSVVVGAVRASTPWPQDGEEGGAAVTARTVALRRLAEPEDVGRAVAFLASDLASYISGATLLVHGGGESRYSPPS